MGKQKVVPRGWLDYSNMGRQIPGTRFIAFKVPLKQDICHRRLPQSEWFTPADLLESAPELKLVVNLTNTDDGRYYNVVDFEEKGIKILPLKCVGRGTLPPEHIVEKFCSAVDNFMCTNPVESDEKSLIGVHCTHGLNRTGYFICRYMVDRMGITPEKAIELFEAARGHPIERYQYLNQIRGVAANSNQDTSVPETIRNSSITNYTSPMDNLYGDNVSSYHYRRNAGPYKNEYHQRRQPGTMTPNYSQYKKYDNYSHPCQSNNGYNPNNARSNHRSRSFMRKREPLPKNWRMREDKNTF